MDISLLIKAIFDPHPNKSTWIQEIIKPGDVFNIKIIDVKEDQRALVDFGKFRALARVGFPVKAGADLIVKVTGTKGQLRLQTVDAESAAAGRGKRATNRLEILSFDLFDKIRSDIKQAAQRILNLPDGQLPAAHIRRALAALDAHFAPIDLSQDATKGQSLLKSYVEDAGFFFEKKIADIIRQFVQRPDADGVKALIGDPQIQKILSRDLKPILMILKEYLETPDTINRSSDPRSLSRFKGMLDMLLADINNQQSRATHRHEAPDPHQVFSFTLPLKEHRKKAHLKLYCPKKKQSGSKAGFKISLLLEMGRIGEVRTDFSLLNKDLAITFFVKDDGCKTQFEDHYEEIRVPLNSLFDYLVLKTVVSQKKIEDFHHEDLEIGSDRQIDLRI